MSCKLNAVLVPVDLGSGSRAALTTALEFAHGMGASVDVLYVWSPDHLGDAARRNAELLLEAFLEELGATTQVATRRFAVGDPRQQIVELAASGGYDLIVIATCAERDGAAAVTGSVMSSVVRHAPCPVMTIGALPG
jgi:universal stress protein A